MDLLRRVGRCLAMAPLLTGGCFGFSKTTPGVPATGAAGQSWQQGMTRGDLGRVDVGYDCALLQCLGVDKYALAAGGARVAMTVSTVSWGNEDYATVQSSDESVVTAVIADSTANLTLTGGQAGTAQLRFLRLDGSLFDTITLTVRDAATLQLDDTLAGVALPLQLMAGGQYLLHVTTVDSGGLLTVGSGAVKFAASGTADDLGPGYFGDAHRFSGSAGSGSMIASAPAPASRSTPIS